MGTKWGLIYLLGIIGVNFVKCDVSFEFMHREDPCISLCEKIPVELFFEGHKGVRNGEFKSNHMKSCCQRGCRFFNLVNFGRGVEADDFNATRDACDSSCKEAYVRPRERSSCAVGCTFMAKQRMIDLLSLLSVALYMEEGIDPNLLVMSLDLPESEFITDPGLKKEMMPGWWDFTGFKLPQTFVKSVPKGSHVMDYNVPSDYSGEMEQPGTLAGSTWLKRSVHDEGKQLAFVVMLILCFASLYITLGILERRSSSKKIIREFTENMKNSGKIVLVYPEEMPSEKYDLEMNEEFDIDEKNLKI